MGTAQFLGQSAYLKKGLRSEMSKKLDIELEYCTMWNYLPEAVSLTEEVMREYDYDIGSYKIVTARDGKFEFSINGELIFSKLETGRFPSNEEIKEAIKARIPQEVPMGFKPS